MSVQKVKNTEPYKQGGTLNYRNNFQKQTIMNRITSGDYVITPRVNSDPYEAVNIVQVSGNYVHIDDFS
jgi:hypothetical protein